MNVNAIAEPATFKTSLKFRTLSLSFHIDSGSPVNVVDESRFICVNSLVSCLWLKLMFAYVLMEISH